MRRRPTTKVDKNQPSIIETFQVCGWSVCNLASAGDGVPDILIGRPGISVLVEIKDGSAKPSDRKLTPAQVEFHDDWRGPLDICTSIDEAHRISVFWRDRVTGFHKMNTRDRTNEQNVPRGTKRI